MTIKGTFEAALLKYIQQNVDQLAEGIRDYSHDHSCCMGHAEDDTCCYCDTSIRLSIDYWVPRGINRSGYKTWQYDGGFSELINTLDRMEDGDE